MEVLLPHISKWFLDKQEHFTAFAQADSRIEGWFKAELLVLFNRLVVGHFKGGARYSDICARPAKGGFS